MGNSRFHPSWNTFTSKVMGCSALARSEMTACKRVVGRATGGLAICACAAVIVAAYPIPAQCRTIATLQPVGPVASTPASATRIVIHGVRFQDHGLNVSDDSKPILDYAATILKQHPEAIVYIGAHTDKERSEDRQPGWNSSLTNRQAQAVATYLKGRGISAGRMILAKTGSSQYGSTNETSAIASRGGSTEMVVLDLAS